MIETNKEDFDKKVLKEKKIVLVDFWGPRCAPCLALSPVLEKLAKKYASKLKIVKMNIEGSRRFCMQLKIMGLPTLIFYKNGKEIKRLAGNNEAIPEKIEKTIKEITSS
jgi:thioredoxin 1